MLRTTGYTIIILRKLWVRYTSALYFDVPGSNLGSGQSFSDFLQSHEVNPVTVPQMNHDRLHPSLYYFIHESGNSNSIVIFWVVMWLTSTWKMEAVSYSEMLAIICKAARRQNPEDQHLHLHRRENLRSSHRQFSVCASLSDFSLPFIT